MNASPETMPTLADAARVNLPATYENARKAIATCYEMDECKDWQDKAAALAAYARMKDDDSLRVLALRIQSRAADRCGELLKQFPAGDELTRYGNARPCNPVVTRSKAAEQAGLSPYEARTAQRVNSVPRDEFERRVESPNPPSVRQLADLGTAKRTVVMARPSVPSRSNHPAVSALQTFASVCERTDPVWSQSLTADDREHVLELLKTVERWAVHSMDNLGGES